MASATYSTLEDWEKTLPRSKMVYPSTLPDWIKYSFWRIYTPLHPFVRDVALTLGVVSHSGRQNYTIGKITSDQNIEAVVNFLISHGYGNHFIAWKDDQELISLRRVVGFKYQYHLRIFEDGEIRGHYEYTPECHPLLHFKAIDQKDCRSEFLKLLGEKIIPA